MKAILLLLTLVALVGCSSGNDQEAAATATATAAAASAGAKADAALLDSMDTWSYFAIPDPMTNGFNRFAAIGSENTVNFAFPYEGDQSAILRVKETGPAETGNGKVYPGYDISISIDRGQLFSRDQGSIEIKFDNLPAENFDAEPPSDGSTTMLFFNSDPERIARFVDRLQSAKTLKVQVTAYQNGSPVFVFNVSGFSLAKMDAAKPASTVSGAP